MPRTYEKIGAYKRSKMMKKGAKIEANKNLPQVCLASYLSKCARGERETNEEIQVFLFQIIDKFIFVTKTIRAINN